MNNTQIEKEINELKQESKTCPVKLSWKQVWIGIVTFLSIVSGSFGSGMKVESEIQKVEKLKMEREFQKQINVVEEKNLELSRNLKEKQEDILFYQNRYLALKEQIKKLEEEYSIFNEKN